MANMCATASAFEYARAHLKPDNIEMLARDDVDDVRWRSNKSIDLCAAPHILPESERDLHRAVFINNDAANAVRQTACVRIKADRPNGYGIFIGYFWKRIARRWQQFLCDELY